MKRPAKEQRLLTIAGLYEDLEFSDFDVNFSGGPTVSGAVDRKRYGLRVRGGTRTAGAYLDVFNEDFGGDDEIWGITFGADGRNRWIEWGDEPGDGLALALDYGIYIGYRYDFSSKEIQYGEGGIRAGLGFDLSESLLLTAGYRGNYLNGDSLISTFDEGTNSGYARVELDVSVLTISGEYLVGDLEGFAILGGFSF
jgi:hypothetical protein